MRSTLGPCELFEILRETITQREHPGWAVAFRTPTGNAWQTSDAQLVQNLAPAGTLSASRHLLSAFWNRGRLA